MQSKLSFGTEGVFVLLWFLFVVILIVIAVVFLIAVYRSAESRGRDAVWWTVLALFVTPFLVLGTLLVLGETEKRHNQRIVEEEKLKIRVREGEKIYF